MPAYLRRYELKDLDRRIYLIISERPKSSSEIANEIGKSKYTVLRALKRLERMGLIEKIGKGKATKYIAKSVAT